MLRASCSSLPPMLSTLICSNPTDRNKRARHLTLLTMTASLLLSYCLPSPQLHGASDDGTPWDSNESLESQVTLQERSKEFRGQRRSVRRCDYPDCDRDVPEEMQAMPRVAARSTNRRIGGSTRLCARS